MKAGCGLFFFFFFLVVPDVRMGGNGDTLGCKRFPPSTWEHFYVVTEPVMTQAAQRGFRVSLLVFVVVSVETNRRQYF